MQTKSLGCLGLSLLVMWSCGQQEDATTSLAPGPTENTVPANHPDVVAAASVVSDSTVYIFAPGTTHILQSVSMDMFVTCVNVGYSVVQTATTRTVTTANWTFTNPDNLTWFTNGADLYVCPLRPGTIIATARIGAATSASLNIQVINSSSITISGPVHLTTGGTKTWTPHFAPAGQTLGVTYLWGWKSSQVTHPANIPGPTLQLNPVTIYGNFTVSVFAYRNGAMVATSSLDVVNTTNGPH